MHANTPKIQQFENKFALYIKGLNSYDSTVSM